MYFECPICGAGQEAVQGVRLDYGCICTCRSCRGGAMVPRPTQGELADLHSDSDYFEHPYFESRRASNPGLLRRYEKRLDLIRRYCAGRVPERVLEIGCDTGAFLGFLSERGCAAPMGIDISERAVRAARAAGLDVRAGTLEHAALDGEGFDAVCAFDLLEHVSDPRALLREVKRILRPGGVFVVETPNYDGLVYRIGRGLARWPVLHRRLGAIQQRLWPPFHVQYFNPGAVRRMVEGAGLVPVRVACRELERSEIAIDSKILRIGLGLVSGAARITRMGTLLVLVAKKGDADPDDPGVRARSGTVAGAPVR